MSLTVSIIKSADSVNITESSKSFGAEGGTIGRGTDNSWVLQDPERYLSTRHCQISNQNGQYFITDLSTNGTFFNGSPNPIGKGTKLPLNGGDTFIVGDYEFSVSNSAIVQAEPSMDGLSADPFAESDSFVQGLGASSGDPFAPPHAAGSDSLFGGSDAEMDPLAALDKAQGKQEFNSTAGNNDADLFASANSADPFVSSPSFSDQASPVNQQISWPDAVAEPSESATGAIPDDWDDDLNLSPAVPATSPPVHSIPLTTPPVIPKSARATSKPVEQKTRGTQNFQPDLELQNDAEILSNKLIAKENAKIHAELESLKQQINAQQRVSGTSTSTSTSTAVTVDTSLIESLGLLKHNLSDAEILKINQLAGDVIKEMVRGLMQVLGSRGSIKNEFRMHVTTIQPVENNPIKFSANVEDALENMFIKQGKAYKKPVEAVQEGFESVAEHQIAILAGIKSAFKGVIERFDPALLEERFSKQNKGGFIPGIQKAKNWDLYHQYYSELAGDIDNSFQYLFGDDFVRAYEEQLQKMTISKKAKKSTTRK